jgi:hypothetical protein
MKKLFKLSFWAIMAGVLLYSCRPEKFKEIDAPQTVASSLAGIWKLIKVTQTDEDAKNKGFLYGPVNVQQMDITSAFPYTDFKLTLNVDGSAPTTFATTPGNSPKIIKLAGGNWTFDDPKYPKVLTLTSGTLSEKVKLGSYPTATSPTLKITSERRDASTNKLLISYSFEFAKQ